MFKSLKSIPVLINLPENGIDLMDSREPGGAKVSSLALIGL
jgi:hypothetical protein